MDKKPFRLNERGNNPKRRGIKNFGFIALIILFGLVIFAAYGQPSNLKDIPLSDVIKQANDGQYQKIVAKGGDLEITKRGEAKPSLKSHLNPAVSLKEEGIDYSKVNVDYRSDSTTSSLWLQIGGSLILPLLMFVGIFYLLRSAQGQGNQALSFGKSRARLYGNEKDKMTFSDMAGSDEAKQDLQEVVEFLKYPKKFEAVGAKIPKGVLLIGPPGT
ncbi:hypothetical protein HY218_00160, partial [Candidatus Saccharibacteria bacterium]|nr:hypothetical protein [Candidatus Saccharibacteria bacterium]